MEDRQVSWWLLELHKLPNQAPESQPGICWHRQASSSTAPCRSRAGATQENVELQGTTTTRSGNSQPDSRAQKAIKGIPSQRPKQQLELKVIHLWEVKFWTIPSSSHLPRWGIWEGLQWVRQVIFLTWVISLRLSHQKARVAAVSPLAGSHCTKGEGGPHTARRSPWGLPWDALRCLPSAAVHGAPRAGLPDELCPENGVPT